MLSFLWFLDELQITNKERQALEDKLQGIFVL